MDNSAVWTSSPFDLVCFFFLQNEKTSKDSEVSDHSEGEERESDPDSKKKMWETGSQSIPHHMSDEDKEALSGEPKTLIWIVFCKYSKLQSSASTPSWYGTNTLLQVQMKQYLIFLNGYGKGWSQMLIRTSSSVLIYGVWVHLLKSP